MIPYFVPKEFAGASPGQIYGMYIRAKEAIIKQSAISSKNEKRVQKNKSKFKKPGG